MEQWWNDTDGRNSRTGRENWPVSLRLLKIPHVFYLKRNQALWCHRPTTNCM